LVVIRGTARKNDAGRGARHGFGATVGGEVEGV
jgi:hypothetical protein